MAERGITRPLVVTDRFLVHSGVIERLLPRHSSSAVFDDVQTNPRESEARAAYERWRAGDCDGLVAIGGGSPIDLAKAAALFVHHPPPLEQYAMARGGMARITAKRPPIIAVPTTAGTGSEVGRAALITLDNGDKLGLVSPHLIPDVAVCDPQLTMSMPAPLTAATGMDAISHCVETYCSPRYNPVAEAIALDGLRRGYGNIRQAVERPSDREARTEMMMAALQGGLTFQKGLGAVHALSHPLGAVPDKKLHHGTLNAIFLPHVLRYNAQTCAAKMQAMADAVGVGRAEKLADAFARLVEELGLPTRLTELGVTAADLERSAPKAFDDHCRQTNPRAMTVEDCATLYAAAL